MQKRGTEHHKFLRNLNSQAALEFLMTYGWAIMVVLVAIGALAYFGVLSPDKFVPSRCITEAGLACTDFEIKDTFVELALRNGKGEDIAISNIKITGCTGTTSGTLRNGEQKTFRVTGCSHTSVSKYAGEFNISYSGESGLMHNTQGKLSGKVAGSNTIQKTLEFREDGTSTNTTNDAEIQENNPGTNYGTQTSLTIDGLSPSAHAVIQFPNIIGSADDQIPSGAQIDSATLTVNCISTAEPPPNAYLLLEDWTESEVTWNSRKSGISWSDAGADGSTSHAGNAVIWDCQWPYGYKNFDMTSFVQNWAGGTANYGVVVVDTGNDGLDFYTSEHSAKANRPLLSVTFTEFS